MLCQGLSNRYRKQVVCFRLPQNYRLSHDTGFCSSLSAAPRPLHVVLILSRAESDVPESKHTYFPRVVSVVLEIYNWQYLFSIFIKLAFTAYRCLENKPSQVNRVSTGWGVE